VDAAGIRNSIALLEAWAIRASVVVAVGVLVEAIAEFTSGEKHESRKKWLSRVGVWIVFVGVAVETLALVLNGRKVDEYRQAEDAQTARANARADTAYQLGLQAGLENRQLREDLATPQVSRERMARMVNDLKLFRSTSTPGLPPSVQIVVPEDKVQYDGPLAEQLDSILWCSGWCSQRVTVPDVVMDTGIAVQYNPRDPFSKQAARVLWRALCQGMRRELSAPDTLPQGDALRIPEEMGPRAVRLTVNK
jgi:hypothetical protein